MNQSSSLIPTDVKAGFLALPHFFLDSLMPKLKEAEFKLLLAVARETIGRKEEGSRRRRAWLTHGRLIQVTGMSGRAVSSAIDALVKKELLEITDEQGFRMLEASVRQRFRGILYFSFSAPLWAAVEVAIPQLLGEELTANSSLKNLQRNKQEEILKNINIEGERSVRLYSAGMTPVARVIPGWRRE